MNKIELNDDELLRYSRHILMPSVDIEGQLAICNGRVLILGLGGLGSPVALYLAAAGVGQFTLVDDDHVESSNLQRQIIHTQDTLACNKAESAAQQMRKLNPSVNIDCVTQRCDHEALQQLVNNCQVVVDCTDNFASRRLTNAVCYEARVPLVSGAAIRMEGQLSTFDFRSAQSPCYECLYQLNGDENLSCSESGVLSPLVGVIGSAQALEVLKILAGFGKTLMGRLQLYDAALGSWREFSYRQDPNCPLCGSGSSL